MDVLIRLNNQSAGRDKIARLFQYSSRIVWHHLQQSNKDKALNVKNFEYQLSTFRKLLRFGKSLDVLYGTIPLLRHEDYKIKVTLTLSKIANSLFLLADHVLWLGRADLCNVDTLKWSNISNKYWLYSIIMNLIRDLQEIKEILKTVDLKDVNAKTIKSLMFNNKNVTVDTVKNLCDFFIPLSALGYVELKPSTVGWLGVLSSLAGLLVLIDPLLKLTPS